MYELIIIKPNGSYERFERTNQPALQELQAFVGGYIEHVNLRWKGENVHGYVNEDGKRLQLPYNPKATAIYQNVVAESGITRDSAVKVYDNLNDEPYSYIYWHADIILGNMVLWTGPVS